MAIDRSKRITFEETADLYDEISLDYPEALVEDVLHLSGIPANCRILEVGCGPGNATVAFARRGYRILAIELAIELGERLASLAAQNCRDFPEVEICNSEFESWELEEDAFDLAIAADAFHWIPPEVGYPKVARALKDYGSAAFFWNVPVQQETECSRAIDAVYQERAPELVNPEKRFTAEWLAGIITENFASSGYFNEVTVRQYSWTEMYTGQRYNKGLRTYSDHRNVNEGTRERLYTGILEVIERFGGSIVQPQQVALFHARVKK